MHVIICVGLLLCQRDPLPIKRATSPQPRQPLATFPPLPQDKLPWFLASQPSAACAKGGAGAYSDAIQRNASDPTGVAGLGERGVVAASSFRASYVVLARQSDFIAALRVGGGAGSECGQGVVCEAAREPALRWGVTALAA